MYTVVFQHLMYFPRVLAYVTVDIEPLVASSELNEGECTCEVWVLLEIQDEPGANFCSRMGCSSTAE